jgi:hypothetical protein
MGGVGVVIVGHHMDFQNIFFFPEGIMKTGMNNNISKIISIHNNDAPP